MAGTGEAAAILARPLMHMPGMPNRDTVVTRLVHTLIDIIGTGVSSQNRSCMHHDACGMQVEVGMNVMFCWEKMIYQDQGQEEDAIVAYFVANGTTMCKVKLLPARLAKRAQDYDGLIARMISIYSNCCTSSVKSQKFWQNKGCCVGCILGD